MTGTTIPGDLTPTPISGYPLASVINPEDLIFISQGGVSKRGTIAQALAAAGAAPTDATYFLLSADADLPSSRVLQFNALQFTPTDNGAGSTYSYSLNFGTASTPLSDAAAAVLGTSVIPAHSDHQHPINVSGTDPVRTTGNPSPGAQPTYARSDHNHGAPPAFTGASAGVDGTLGGVTMPLAGEQTYFLRGDGTWVLAPGTGTVTSVGLALPAEFTVTNSPVTVSGTLTGAWASASANAVFAGPNGAPGTPSFRGLVAADIPGLPASTITSGVLVIARGGTGVGTVPTNGQILIGNGTDYTLAAPAGTANQVIVTAGAGSLTFSLPQSIAAASTPAFAGLTVGTLTGPIKGTAGLLSASAIDLSGAEVTGNLGVSHLDSGTNASASSVWYGDGTWKAIPTGFVDPMTTAGDMIFRNAANTTARLPVGSTGAVLAVSAATAIPTYTSAPATTGAILQGLTTGVPTWSTATYPSTVTAPAIVVSNANNVFAALAATTANRLVGTTNGTSVAMVQVDLATAMITGNLPVTALNSGTGASASTVWTGNGTWAAAGLSLAQVQSAALSF